MPNINPNILCWARETAGLTLEDAAKKLAIAPTKDASGPERLAALEAGNVQPTRATLAKMARSYRRPLVTFYLSAPPRRGDRGEDFRTLPDSHTQADDAQLDVLIRDIRARQSMVRAVLEDEEEAEPLSFIGSAKMSDGTEAIYASICEALQFSLLEYRSPSLPTEAFKRLRRRTEETGVFVLLIGNLGSHHTDLSTKLFRGLALADDVAPFVVINSRDSEEARSFTLLHELAHLWLGQTGVSGARGEISIERFCNEVASKFLLPEEELDEISLSNVTDVRSIKRGINSFAHGRHLSHSMVAYRLFQRGDIDKLTWGKLSKFYGDKWRENRGKPRKTTGGPSFYTLRRYQVGTALLELTSRMVSAGALTTSKAGIVLGVKAKQVQKLLDTSGHNGAHQSG